MNYKILLSAVLFGVLSISGCTSDNVYYEDVYDYSEQPQPVTEIRKSCPSAQYPGAYDPKCVAEDEYVNYTKVAADYRAYGERTPRDHMIVENGAGSNMSATIPPSIEGEVVEYEAEISDGNYSEAEQLKEETAASDEGFATEDPVEDWLAEEGKSLKGILTEWCDRSGWRLVWNTNRNYTLTAGAMFRGRFADVSSALIRAFARARPAPIATFYKGNRVLVIETMEDENAYE